MSETETILVVVDPTRDTHPALARAATNLRQRKDDAQAKLMILLAVNDEVDNIHANNPNIVRSVGWVNEELEKSGCEPIDHETLISWSSDWAQTALNIIADKAVTLVMIPFYDDGKKHVLCDEEWKLLRNIEQPTILVSDRSKDRNIILATIRSQDHKYDDLNQQIIKRAQQGVEIYGAELHVVNAYSDSMDYPDRVKIANMVGVPNEQVHIANGSPQDVIHEVSEKIGADVVLIGNNRRTGLKGKLRGNTIEKIVEHLGTDVMMI